MNRCYQLTHKHYTESQETHLRGWMRVFEKVADIFSTCCKAVLQLLPNKQKLKVLLCRWYTDVTKTHKHYRNVLSSLPGPIRTATDTVTASLQTDRCYYS